MANETRTTLNMLLQLRRDDVFTSTYKLAAGEPGFEISTNTLKIGDGEKTWAELPIANKKAIDDLIKVVDDKVAALNDTFATDVEVEAIRADLDAAKLDKQTYLDYIATHALTDTEINKAIGDVDAKFAAYRTAADQDVIDEAIKARLVDLEAVDHTHANKDLLDTYTQTEADLADAVTKKHAHAFVEDELNQIVAGDVEKWNAVVADHLDAADLETINGAIEDAVEAAAEALADYQEEMTETLAGKQDVIPANTYDTYGAAGQALTDAKSYVDEEDIFVTDMNTINSLGGIGANVNLNGLTTHEVLKKLLYPYVSPTIGGATASPNGGTYEKGVTKTITQVSISITKKSEPITSVALYNGSTLIEEKSGDAVKNGGTITFTGLSVVVPTDGNQLTVKVTYPDATGAAKTESKSTTAMTFVYPYYMGTCAAGTAIDETLVESLTKKIESKGNKSHSFDLNDSHIVFAYPKAHGALKSVIDPNGYETISGYNRSEVSVTGLDNTAQTYYVYVSKDSATSTGFTVTFKY